mmetsp:Transcript_133091/g.384998  ORF Transcript_133091/g.384998 Transcript_133091/m.384998 type:complete len:251 (-) Transcript_133091:85-837(-)
MHLNLAIRVTSTERAPVSDPVTKRQTAQVKQSRSGSSLLACGTGPRGGLWSVSSTCRACPSLLMSSLVRPKRSTGSGCGFFADGVAVPVTAENGGGNAGNGGRTACVRLGVAVFFCGDVNTAVARLSARAGVLDLELPVPAMRPVWSSFGNGGSPARDGPDDERPGALPMHGGPNCAFAKRVHSMVAHSVVSNAPSAARRQQMYPSSRPSKPMTAYSTSSSTNVAPRSSCKLCFRCRLCGQLVSAIIAPA